MFEGARWAEVIEESKDKGPYKIFRVRSEGHEFDVTAGESFGMQSSPIKGGQVLIVPFNSDNGQGVAIATLPPPAKRVDEQKPGEVSVKNHITGNRRYMDNEGDTREATKRDFIAQSERNNITEAKNDSVERPKRHHHIETGGICYINCGGAPATPTTKAKMLEV